MQLQPCYMWTLTKDCQQGEGESMRSKNRCNARVIPPLSTSRRSRRADDNTSKEGLSGIMLRAIWQSRKGPNDKSSANESKPRGNALLSFASLLRRRPRSPSSDTSARCSSPL